MAIKCVQCQSWLLPRFLDLKCCLFFIKTHKFLLPNERCVSCLQKAKHKMLKKNSPSFFCSRQKFELKNITRKLVVYRHVSVMDSNSFISSFPFVRSIAYVHVEGGKLIAQNLISWQDSYSSPINNRIKMLITIHSDPIELRYYDSFNMFEWSLLKGKKS